MTVFVSIFQPLPRKQLLMGSPRPAQPMARLTAISQTAGLCFHSLSMQNLPPPLRVGEIPWEHTFLCNTIPPSAQDCLVILPSLPQGSTVPQGSCWPCPVRNLGSWSSTDSWLGMKQAAETHAEWQKARPFHLLTRPVCSGLGGPGVTPAEGCTNGQRATPKFEV